MKIKKVIKGSSFNRAFKKLCSQNSNFLELFQVFFRQFALNPKSPKFQVHKLKGDLKGCYAAKIEYDLRLIFSYKNEEITLIDIGTHDAVY